MERLVAGEKVHHKHLVTWEKSGPEKRLTGSFGPLVIF